MKQPPAPSSKKGQNFTTCTLKELCPEDKQKVAKLVKQVVELGQENHRLKDAADKAAAAAEEKVRQVQECNREAVKENGALKAKLGQAVTVLRMYHHKVGGLDAALRAMQHSATAVSKPQQQQQQGEQEDAAAAADDCSEPPAADADTAAAAAQGSSPVPTPGKNKAAAAASGAESPPATASCVGGSATPVPDTPLVLPGRRLGEGQLLEELARWQVAHGLATPGAAAEAAHSKVLQFDPSIGSQGAFVIRDPPPLPQLTLAAGLEGRVASCSRQEQQEQPPLRLKPLAATRSSAAAAAAGRDGLSEASPWGSPTCQQLMSLAQTFDSLAAAGAAAAGADSGAGAGQAAPGDAAANSSSRAGAASRFSCGATEDAAPEEVAVEALAAHELPGVVVHNEKSAGSLRWPTPDAAAADAGAGGIGQQLPLQLLPGQACLGSAGQQLSAQSSALSLEEEMSGGCLFQERQWRQQQQQWTQQQQQWTQQQQQWTQQQQGQQQQQQQQWTQQQQGQQQQQLWQQQQQWMQQPPQQQLEERQAAPGVTRGLAQHPAAQWPGQMRQQQLPFLQHACFGEQQQQHHGQLGPPASCGGRQLWNEEAHAQASWVGSSSGAATPQECAATSTASSSKPGVAQNGVGDVTAAASGAAAAGACGASIAAQQQEAGCGPAGFAAQAAAAGGGGGLPDAGAAAELLERFDESLVDLLQEVERIDQQQQTARHQLLSQQQRPAWPQQKRPPAPAQARGCAQACEPPGQQWRQLQQHGWQPQQAQQRPAKARGSSGGAADVWVAPGPRWCQQQPAGDQQRLGWERQQAPPWQGAGRGCWDEDEDDLVSDILNHLD